MLARSRLLAVVAAPLVLLAALLAPTVPAHAVGESYVALGDSHASGTGPRSSISDGTSCRLSTYAHPSPIAAQKGYALIFKACSGEKIPDVPNDQTSALSSTRRLVTISAGTPTGRDARLDTCHWSARS